MLQHILDGNVSYTKIVVFLSVHEFGSIEIAKDCTRSEYCALEVKTSNTIFNEPHNGCSCNRLATTHDAEEMVSIDLASNIHVRNPEALANTNHSPLVKAIESPGTRACPGIL